MKKFVAFVALTLIVGCASVDLTEAGRSVKVVETIASHCESLGFVNGEGGNSWTGGAWYKNSSLLDYASNDLRNKAAGMGATHVVIKSSNFGESHGRYGGTVTGANLTGTAYRCEK